MRHIFDQYSQPENKITHAFVSCLSQDRKLLREFVKWAIGKKISAREKLFIVEQSLPGEEDVEEGESERRGLPDAWIYTEDGWSLIIESKVAAPLKKSQLIRHLNTAKRRGFDKVNLLAIIMKGKKLKDLKGLYIKHWSDIYEWCIKNGKKSDWIGLFSSYLEIVEAKLVHDEYLKEGKLTRFTGIKFDSYNPYTYIEGKRILKLITAELKKDKAFMKKLNIDPNKDGRGAITGKTGFGVWDFISFKQPRESSEVTNYPHLTISVKRNSFHAALTLPNGMKRKERKNIIGKDYGEFSANIVSVLKNMKKILKIDKSIKPYAKVGQVHFPTRGSDSITDATLYCDLRTGFERKEKKWEKYQPEWLEAIYNVLVNKRSNLQFQVGINVDYRFSKAIKTNKAICLIKESFLALKPLINKINN